MNDRESFEAWRNTRALYTVEPPAKFLEWNAWQAATAAERERIIKLIKEDQRAQDDTA